MTMRLAVVMVSLPTFGPSAYVWRELCLVREFAASAGDRRRGSGELPISGASDPSPKLDTGATGVCCKMVVFFGAGVYFADTGITGGSRRGQSLSLSLSLSLSIYLSYLSISLSLSIYIYIYIYRYIYIYI